MRYMYCCINRLFHVIHNSNFICFQKSTELKIDPSDDFFADAPLSPKVNQSEPSQPLSETGSKMETGSQEANNGKPKRVR